MNNKDITELYDNNPNMLLSELAQITGKTVKQLKSILMGHKS